MRGNVYQSTLIVLGIVVTMLFGVFLYRELMPEYKIYQKDYFALETFRSDYTGDPPPPFSFGVKQIVLEQPNNAPAIVDRCTSCHVAVQFEHFSPTRLKRDINGNIVRDKLGVPEQETNPDYIWAHLDQKIKELQTSGTDADLKEAEYLTSLKTAKVGDRVYDVTKVLEMHPLIGKETRPFELHPLDEYGCTSCHSGNGRGLTTDKAHGPVFDEQYEIAHEGPKPLFVEPDPENDPKFARVFNHKPGHSLLFQTDPLLVGNLIQAKCIQCHQRSADALMSTASNANVLSSKRMEQSKAVKMAFDNEKKALVSLLQVREWIQNEGYNKTLKRIDKALQDYTLPPQQLEFLASQQVFLKKNGGDDTKVLKKVDREIEKSIGTEILAKKLEESIQPDEGQDALAKKVDLFIQEQTSNPNATGSLFAKATAVALEKQLMRHVSDTKTSFSKAASDENVISAIQTDVDRLTQNFHSGQNLYISQACYACHRISGFSRGGIGPEHTYAGEHYPWFLKESVVWPQADLKTSTMPNFKMDHEELEDIVTFMLSLNGKNNTVSETAYKIDLAEWESGAKLPWEKPVTPSQMHDVSFGMTVFATQGCAACHRLKGFESDVGFAVEKTKEDVDFNTLYAESKWFRQLFPEEIQGSELARKIEKHAPEIDKRITDNVREDSIIEEIRAKNPQAIDGLYTNFKYASRAKNSHYNQLAAQATDPDKKEEILNQLQQWKDRVHRVLMVYIQEYGLGRLIGPRPNWAGVYRSDEWLMEHFRNPQAHVARSIMPVLPFDDTKFYALTYMLDILGKKNRDAVRAIWENKGFNPEQAYDIFCAQCHGTYLQGNGPIAEWIYPIPKNLRSGDFLRNLTKANAVHSITHGVKGGPMPPWGEAPPNKPDFDDIRVITKDEINSLVDWLYSTLPGAKIFKSEEDVPKWQYKPEDAIKELQDEGGLKELLQGSKENSTSKLYAALEPTVNPNSEIQVSEIFDVISNPESDGEENNYYIKQQLYTPKNLEAAKVFFNIHCATCHGREGDGAGDRAGTMQDAKPRMLTNLDWLHTRDDLRLLRSLKYGVSGTAMTPWGDQTSSLQRLQLIMYIRALSHQSNLRDQLLTTLYQAYRQGEIAIEKARVKEYPKIALLEDQYTLAQEEKNTLDTKAQLGEVKPSEAVEAYQKELKLFAQLKDAKQVDQVLLQLREQVNSERKIYEGLGMSMVNKNMGGELFKNLIEAIELNAERFSFLHDELVLQLDPEDIKKIETARDGVLNLLDQKIKKMEEEKIILQGRIASAQRSTDLSDLNANIGSYRALRNQIISGFEEAARSRARQQKLYQQYQKKAG